MYQTLPSFVLGFHGCDKDTAESVLAGESVLKTSKNDYDWLGDGIYFWENSPERAFSYASMLSQHKNRTKGHVKTPFVIGAILDLGVCLNLTDENALLQLASAYQALEGMTKAANKALPSNTPGFRGDSDEIKRHLDCAVFQTLHALRKSGNLPAYDTVRSPFFEGSVLYPGGGFTSKAHVQIAVRNIQCIKGYFRPLGLDGKPMHF